MSMDTKNSFTIVSFFKLVLWGAIGSLVLRPLASGLDTNEISAFLLLQIIAGCVAAGLAVGAIMGLTQYRQGRGFLSGMFVGFLVGLFFACVFASASDIGTASTMVIVAAVVVFSGLAENVLSAKKRRSDLTSLPPPRSDAN